MVTSVEPILACPDLVATMAFYTDVLGFRFDWVHGDPPAHGSVTWGSTSLMFSQNPELARRVRGQEFFINVDGIEKLYAQHRKANAPIVFPLEPKPWGRDEYTIKDPNGYLLRFNGIAAEEKSSAPLAAQVTFEPRLPTLDEFLTLIPDAKREDVARSLEVSHSGVVAQLESGEIIGMARAVVDSPGWISVWDVQVREDLRGQHVGEGLMRRLLERLREEFPGAFVYLFTFRHGFYAKLGFGTQSVTMLRL